MPKPLNIVDLPEVMHGEENVLPFYKHGADIKMMPKEATALGYLLDDGEPRVAHTKIRYEYPGDFSRIKYPVVVPVYTDLEAHLIKGILELKGRMEGSSPDTIYWPKDLAEMLGNILGVHNRTPNEESVSSRTGNEFEI